MGPPFFDLFRGCDFLWYFCWFRVHFWRPFGTLWAHFGVLLAQIGSLLVPCRARFWLFCTLGCSFWFVVGEINLLRQYFAKKYTCIDLASNFLQIFRMQIIFPRPGGGTIAAGNRDSPPGRAQPARGACWDWVTVLRVSFPHAPFPRSRSGFCSILFFSRRIPSWIPPFPSLVGRLICTFWRPFGWKWVVVFSLCFFGVFLDDFWRVFD